MEKYEYWIGETQVSDWGYTNWGNSGLRLGYPGLGIGHTIKHGLGIRVTWVMDWRNTGYGFGIYRFRIGETQFGVWGNSWLLEGTVVVDWKWKSTGE